jgi:glutamate 5-kinase
MKPIIKIGSRVLTQSDGQLNREVAINLVGEIARLRNNGSDVVLVTSGAVSLGRSVIDLVDFKVGAEMVRYSKDVIKEQILASVGQPLLMEFYTQEFKKHNVICAQILATRSDFANKDAYLSLRTVVENLLRLGIVPIFNENDVLSPEGLDFSDNDQLASMIAAMLVADKLILLTNVDGVYDGSPKDPASKIIPVIENAGDFMGKVDRSMKSGKGGMSSKLMSADLITSLGISMHIANGLEKNILSKIFIEGEIVGTFFPARDKKVRVTKGWIATAAVTAGKKIIVSTYLADILRKRSKTPSILFAGIERVEGNFSKDDIVEICDDEGKVLGRGQCRFDSDVLGRLVSDYRLKGDTEKAKVRTADTIAVHYDYFVFV